jgi:Dot/Icm secretion system protein IcmQ
VYHKEAKDILVNAIDKVITEGNWEGSLFFRNILKRLEKLREFVITELSDTEEQAAEDIVEQENLKEQQGYKKVYIAIYQAKGEQLAGWFTAVKNLDEYYVSRPAYLHENHAQEMINAKRSRNDAYVAVWIHQDNILATDKMHDKLGHELLTLREGSINVENIIEFVHDKNRYCFTENKLVLR